MCGSARFDYPLVITDDAEISCSHCGRKVGTVAEIQAQLIEQITSDDAKHS
uniref:hypothetical protein n=1 Tax=Sphingosinicella rhizophila TaxID=3050082 RepID=UPI0028EDC85D|nr:hypothetical protein [Sphingosinicella sp. GR2756]